MQRFTKTSFEPKQIVSSLTLALAFTGSTSLFAEENQAYQLAPLEVMANPVIKENHLDSFSSISSVITDEQLKDQNALDLASALRRTPGVQITRFNPVGTFSGDGGDGVFVRGMGTSRPGSEIKTYVDGVPLYMGVWGHPVLDMLPINGMESITVYKGPQPQINGNNFSSINLSTKRAIEDGLHGSARVSGGIYGTISEQADITGKYGDLDFSLAQGFATSDGHRDNADGELKNVMGSLNYQLNTNWSIGTHFIYSNNEASDPGSNTVTTTPTVKYKSEVGVVSVNLSHQYEKVQGDLRLYHTTGEGNWLDHPSNSNPAVNTNTLSSFDTFGLSWKEQIISWDGGTITVGLDSDWLSGNVTDSVDLAFTSQGYYETPTFRITSPYLSITQVFDINENWSLVPSAGIRYYNHSEFEEQISPHAGVSLVSEKLTLYANISRGINYPGLEVATLSKYIAPLGNTWKNLSPEQVEHGEIGFKATPFESTQIDVSFFNDRIKNRYIFAFPPLVSFPQFKNFGTYTMRGFEVSVQQDITENWRVFGSLTMLDPSIDNLPYVPKTAVSGGIIGKIEDVRLAIDAQYQSETMTFNNKARNANVGGSGANVSSLIVLNARAGYPIPQLGEKGEIFISGENLLDRDYEYRPGYPMPGIWGQIGIAASF